MGFKIKAPKIKIDSKSLGNVFKNTVPIGQTLGAASSLAKMFKPKAEGGGGAEVGPNGQPIFGVRNTEEFMKDNPAEQIQRVKLADDGGALKRRFDVRRERAGQENVAAVNQADDALKRRFSAIGGAGSGAAIKLQQQMLEKGNQQKAQAFEDISTAEEDAVSQRDMAQAQMDHQTNLAQADMNFKNKVFNFERGSKLHELDLAERQQQYDAYANEVNARTAAQMAKPPKQGLLSGLLDGII